VEVPAKKPSAFRIVVIVWRVLYLIIFSIRLKYQKHLKPRDLARQIRQLFEMLGGMWIKMGQVLSMRNDLFSAEFCDELLKLQDQAYAFPAELSVQMIEKNLGCPVSEVFDHFDPKPFAAASLSQVHKGFLREQQVWVAIKIQRPYAWDIFNYDFKCLSFFFKILDRFKSIEHFHWKEMLEEIRAFMEEELDYRNEASEMKKMRKNLRPHKVYVPKVFMKFTTRTLLVTEFLSAVFMSEYIKVARADPHRAAAWMDQNGLEPKKLARRLLHSLMRQMFEDYAFHGDLHPGNIIFLKKNWVGLIDFGNTGSFDRDFISKYDQYSRAMSAGNFSTAADMFLLFSGSIPSVDVALVKKDVVKALQEAQRKSSIPKLPFHEKSLAATSADVNKLLAKYKFDINWSLLKMGRTFSALDQAIGALYPEIDYVKESRRYYIDSAQRRKSRDLQVLAVITQKISDISSIVMPLLTSRSIDFKGSLSHAVRATAFLLQLVHYFMCFYGLVLLWTYVYQHHTHVVKSFHDSHDNFLLSYVENFPQVPEFWWWWLLAVMGIATLKFRAFVMRVQQAPVRLPGQAASTRT
jgi:ubiquinone biosynthesis protein